MRSTTSSTPPSICEATVVVETLTDAGASASWIPQRVFSINGTVEALGLACTLSASIADGTDLDSTIESLSNTPRIAPGGRYVITVSDIADGQYLATLEERVGGRLTIVAQRDDAKNFYETYGRVISEMILRAQLGAQGTNWLNSDPLLSMSLDQGEDLFTSVSLSPRVGEEFVDASHHRTALRRANHPHPTTSGEVQ